VNAAIAIEATGHVTDTASGTQSIAAVHENGAMIANSRAAKIRPEIAAKNQV
jgi:hypothetical protein